MIAATGSTNGVHERYQRAVELRIAGGSWGVIARLLGVRASRVVATLAAFERTQPPGQVGSVAAVLASVGAANAGGNGNGAAGDGSVSNGSGGGSNGNGNGGGGSPSPSPSPSGPVDTVVDRVDKTVGDVLSLVPTPTPSPTRTRGPLLPVPLPSVNLPLLPTPH